MDKPLISVLMSLHKTNQFFNESLDSIVNQSYSNIELLIMKDGLKDESEIQTLDNISNKDRRIKVFENEKNLGLTKSLNILLENSNSTIIARHDLDDISNHLRLEKQIKFLKNNNLDACFTYASSLQNGKILHKRTQFIPLPILLKIKNPFVHGTMLIEKDALESVGGYNENFKYAQDYKLYLDLTRNGKKLQLLKETLYKLNMENNISTNFKNEQAEYAKLAKKNKEF